MDKFSIDEYMVKIMPWWALILILCLFFWSNAPIQFWWEYDVLYAFVFICLSYIAWEILQTVSHLLDFVINVWFKFRKPTEVFLYKENPVLKNEHKRKEILEALKVGEEIEEILNIEYKDLNWLKFWKISKKNNAILQSFFWTIYTSVKNNPEIKQWHINYLFLRAIILDCLVLSILSFYYGYPALAWISLIVLIILFWRARWLARWSVFNAVLCYMNEHKEK